jgi:hypothetical protein
MSRLINPVFLFSLFVSGPVLEKFIASGTQRRRMATFDDVPAAKAHDLWNVENRQVYDPIISLMGNFMIENGAGNSQTPE